MFLEKKLTIKGQVLNVQQVEAFTNKEGKTSEPSIRLYFNSLTNNGKLEVFTIKIKECDIEDKDLLGLQGKTVLISDVQEVGFDVKYYNCLKENVKTLKES